MTPSISHWPSWVHGLTAAGLVAILWLVLPWIWAALQSPEVSHWIRVCGPLCDRCDRAFRRKAERRRHAEMLRELKLKHRREAIDA